MPTFVLVNAVCIAQMKLQETVMANLMNKGVGGAKRVSCRCNCYNQAVIVSSCLYMWHYVTTITAMNISITSAQSLTYSVIKESPILK